MAVAKMKLVSIIGHIRALDAVIFACGKTGVAQLEDTLTFYSDTSDFATMQEENPYTDPLSRLESAIIRAGSEIEPVDLLVLPTVDRSKLFDYVNHFTKEISELTRQRSMLSTQIETMRKDLEQYEHFVGLSIDLDEILSCKTIKVRFGRLPKESYDKLPLYDTNPYVIFFPGAEDGEYYWGCYFAPLDHVQDVDRIFSSLYFERLRIPSATGTPDEIVAHLRSDRDAVEQQLKDIDAKLREILGREKETAMQVYEQLKQLHYYFSARRYAARYNDQFALVCWVPGQDEKAIAAALDEVPDIEFTIEKPDSDSHHVPPVKLKNPRIHKPFEFFVDMYGLPRYNEIDPTVFLAVTYTILFGIMFGDVGQGIIVAILGWLAWKYKKMAIGRILIPCGISSTLFGFVFGSVFGFEHVLDPLYKSVFGLHEKPIEVLKPSMTPIILVAAAGIGLVIIVMSMLINIYSSLKRKDYVNGVFGPNGIAGLVFYTSLIFGLISMLLKWNVMTPLYIICLIVIPVLLMFLREPLGELAAGEEHWQPASWGEYCVQNFFELFEMMLSYLSNTMSFLRVGAFVLVHAGMMMAVFTLAELTGGVSSILVIIVGNIIVMAMEGLLVAIQVMRLEFYEMFSRYYIGDGEPFRPLDTRLGLKTVSDRV